MNERFLGAGVALVTPFTQQLEPDLPALERLVDFVTAGGVDYLVVMGTTAESATLDREEKQEVLRAVRKANRGRLPLIAGIGGNNTKGVVSEILETDLQGYEAVLSVSPYYNRPSQEGIFQHFKAIAQACPVPLILYNVPSRTGSNVLPATVLRLAEASANIIGIKEASGDMDQIRALIGQSPDGFMIISGDDHTAVPTVLDGGAGVISVLGQGIPDIFSRMIRLARKGESSEAMKMHNRLEPLVDMIFREGNPAGIKGLLAHLGICLPGVRLPLVPPSETLRSDLGAFLKRELELHL
jgi:4-hydroxy-tetrahydrodipicolinate synthase